jgi:hypothetical protein
VRSLRKSDSRKVAKAQSSKNHEIQCIQIQNLLFLCVFAPLREKLFNLITRFEQKIQVTLARVWGEEPAEEGLAQSRKGAKF